LTVPPAKGPSILCVDDDARALEGLRLTLRQGYSVSAAGSGMEGLALLKQCDGVAVVLSDMRMPGMDGAAFLAKVRAQWPDTVRLLLTGETGRDAAVAAVNDGQIFRFLTKPCAPDKLVAAVAAAVRQHELITAERLLLQQTLMGSIQALVDILSIVNPQAFGRGSRIKRLALELAKAAGLPSSWELEAASLLSQLGYVSLPGELVERVANGAALSAAETQLVAEAPKLTQTLIARIPRLQSVADILAQACRAHVAKDAAAPVIAAGGTAMAANAAVLMHVLEFDALTAQGKTADAAIATLRAHGGAKHAALLEHFAALQGTQNAGPQLREIRLGEVQPGMILADDVRTEKGTLLVSRGYEISPSFVIRMQNFGPGLLEERVRVQLVRQP
jgi:response regulator RpfG family c-di-GMP phosphodiesterase